MLAAARGLSIYLLTNGRAAVLSIAFGSLHPGRTARRPEFQGVRLTSIWSKSPYPL
jgi:hypothetical protein